MVFQETVFTLKDGRTALLRSPCEGDAEQMLRFIIKASGETDFLMRYPEEFAGLLARQLKSPKAIDRMASYLVQARPGSIETIVDEMLAICADTEAWREKAESREARWRYSAWLNSEERMQSEDE